MSKFLSLSGFSIRLGSCKNILLSPHGVLLIERALYITEIYYVHDLIIVKTLHFSLCKMCSFVVVYTWLWSTAFSLKWICSAVSGMKWQKLFCLNDFLYSYWNKKIPKILFSLAKSRRLWNLNTILNNCERKNIEERNYISFLQTGEFYQMWI